MRSTTACSLLLDLDIQLGRHLRDLAGDRGGAILRLGLNREVMNSGKAVFHILEGDEDLLAVLCDGLLVCRLRSFVVRAVASSREDR